MSQIGKEGYDIVFQLEGDNGGKYVFRETDAASSTQNADGSYNRTGGVILDMNWNSGINTTRPFSGDAGYFNNLTVGNSLNIGLNGAYMNQYDDQWLFHVNNWDDYYTFSFGKNTDTFFIITNSGGGITSDYRLKENIEPIPDTFTVDNLKPCVYTYKTDNKIHTGFIAHELQESFPHMVIGEKDGEKMQAIIPTELIAILVKEVQDLKTNVKQLQEKVLELEKNKCTCCKVEEL
jgi:hypothetical protein